MAEGKYDPGDDISWGEIRALARARLGISRFRPGQRQLIQAVLAGRSAIGLLPTGAGKSLCFQIPALLLRGTVIVVSPLIALMQDQKDHLLAANIESARLDSTVPVREQSLREAEVGAGSHDIVLVTPERLQNPDNLEAFKQHPVGLFVVDEAHCISQWGHDFRPAYAQLRHVISTLGSPPVLALTATATPELLDDIRDKLGIANAQVVQTGIERDNLFLEVQRTVNRHEKEAFVLDLLQQQQGSGIIYVATVKRADEIFRWLKQHDASVERYHGQMPKRERQRSQQDFMNGKVRWMVATNAFGLGIDKPDVRFVVHWHFPGSVESYYQEAGRAGRDGQAARCILLYRLEDKRIRAFFMGGKHPRKSDVLALMAAFARVPLMQGTLTQLARAAALSTRRASVLISALEQLDLLERDGKSLRLLRRLTQQELTSFIEEFDALQSGETVRLDTMMKYGDMAGCRMQFLREYFGEPQGEPCKHCDNCCSSARPDTRDDSHHAHVTTPARPGIAFETGARVTHRTFGAGQVISVEDEQIVVSFADGERRILAAKLRVLKPRSSGRKPAAPRSRTRA